MRVRHRVPTIFNLSMVDVLCCALGCVILLWLLNLQQAKERAALAGRTSEHLKAAESSLAETTAGLRGALGERDQARRDLATTRARLATLDQTLAALRAQQRAAEDRLAREKADGVQRLLALEARLSDQERRGQAAARRADQLAGTLRDAEARAHALAQEVGDRKRQLAEAGDSIGGLQRENRSLADEARRVRAAVANRFEGIALTGRRVIFLVDTSGSMELVDERTPDSSKWQGVRDTVARLMRSLPGLEKFQVLIFSDRVSYLLGNDGEWLSYDPRTSTDRVVRALAAIKPDGTTNMHDAFQAAFRFRAAGLDTIYVLSDGLPNTGPGLTAEQAANLRETERSELLARYIRYLLRRDWNRPLPGQPRVRINTIGFFFESPDVGAFLWALARENDGSFVGMSRP